MWRCKECDSAYLDPQPNDDVLRRAYENYYTHNSIQNQEPLSGGSISALKKIISGGYRRWRYLGDRTMQARLAATIMRLFPTKRDATDFVYRYLPAIPGRLLDFGCGNGDFLHVARTLGWEAVGMDFDAAAVDTARARGLEAYVGGVDELRELPVSFDAITMAHVIEHVRAPLALIEAAHVALKPSGSLYLELPNINSIGHKIHGRHWRGLEAPRHLAFPSHYALRKALIEGGFGQVRFHYRSRLFRRLYLRGMYQKSSTIRAGLDPEGPAHMNAPLPAFRDRLRATFSPSSIEFLIVSAIKRA
jgi:2-polyprenyl-3-methyl-5-hydroxy-6-metoxy-1,4-benzoquinol methylase